MSAATTLIDRHALSATDYRCDAGPHDAPYTEVHRRFSIAYVRAGSFGYRYRGETYELVAGSVLVGHAGDEFVCTHEHHRRRRRVSLVPFFRRSRRVVRERGTTPGRVGGVPPLPELIVLGELAQAAADGRSDVGLDEAALLFANRFAEIAVGRARDNATVHARDRRRAVEAALSHRRMRARADRPRRRGD